MPTETVTVMEFHLSRELPNAAGFAIGLSGTALLGFSIGFADEDAPVFLGIIGVLLLLISLACFTFRRIVRMNNRTGDIENIVRSCFWKRNRNYSISDFSSVGIGMGGQSYIKTSTRYFVQLLGRTNLNIPGTSSQKEKIIELADQIGSYLGLPVEKKPKAVFFQHRW